MPCGVNATPQDGGTTQGTDAPSARCANGMTTIMTRCSAPQPYNIVLYLFYD